MLNKVDRYNINSPLNPKDTNNSPKKEDDQEDNFLIDKFKEMDSPSKYSLSKKRSREDKENGVIKRRLVFGSSLSSSKNENVYADTLRVPSEKSNKKALSFLQEPHEEAPSFFSKDLIGLNPFLPSLTIDSDPISQEKSQKADELNTTLLPMPALELSEPVKEFLNPNVKLEDLLKDVIFKKPTSKFLKNINYLIGGYFDKNTFETVNVLQWNGRTYVIENMKSQGLQHKVWMAYKKNSEKVRVIKTYVTTDRNSKEICRADKEGYLELKGFLKTYPELSWEIAKINEKSLDDGLMAMEFVKTESDYDWDKAVTWEEISLENQTILMKVREMYHKLWEARTTISVRDLVPTNVLYRQGKLVVIDYTHKTDSEELEENFFKNLTEWARGSPAAINFLFQKEFAGRK